MITLDKAKGCPEQPEDYRDIVLGDIPFTPDPNIPSWEKGFSNEEKYGKLKREHQGLSLSCVGQGWSKYAEMLNLMETGEFIDLSARDAYSQIFLPHGGAYVRDGAKIVVSKGVTLESLMPSYDNGKNPDEPFMRQRLDESADTISKAMTFKAKKFVWVDTQFPFIGIDWENMRQVIWQLGGFVSGWSGHCVYAEGFGAKDGFKYIHFVNSYGEGSDWYLWEGDTDYKYYNSDKYKLYDITFLVDLPNPPDKIDMLKIIGDKRDKRQYVEGDDKVLHWIFGQPGQDSAILDELHRAGVIDKHEVIWLNDISGYVMGSPWVASR